MADAYKNIDQQTLDAIKWPPALSPSVSYGDDNRYNGNHLKGTLWQFAYRYIYDDNEKSVLSPYSKIPVPDREVLGDGSYADTEYLNNYIKVSCKFGHDTVEKLQLFVRRGNTGSWYLAETVDKLKTSPAVTIKVTSGSKRIEFIPGGSPDPITDLYPGLRFAESGYSFIILSIDYENNYLYVSNEAPFNYTYYQPDWDLINYFFIFRNNKVMLAVDQDDVARDYDRVPQLAGHQELISSKRILYADITEGYDNVDIDTALSDAHVEQDDLNLGLTNLTFDRDSSSPYGDNEIYLPYQSDCKYYLRFTVDNGAGEQILVSDTYDGKSQSDLKDEFKELLEDLADVISANTTTNGVKFTTTDVINADYSWVRFDRMNVYKSFKLGSTQKFGLLYFDRAGRSGAVNSSSKSEVSIIDFYNTVGVSSPAVKSYIEWKIKHKPPEWATHYQWVWGGNQTMSWWMQTLIYAPDAASPDIEVSTDKIAKITINTLIEAYNEHEKKSQVSHYVWQKGDRIRVLGHYSTSGVFTKPHLHFDREITGIEYEEAGSTYKKDDNGDFVKDEHGNKVRDTQYVKIVVDNFVYDPSDFDSAETILIEIYRPQKESETNVFYEIGECFEIGNAGEEERYHKGDTQDQDPDNLDTIPAEGTFDFGDTYLRRRSEYASDPIGHELESPNISDYYDSDSIDIGRPNIENAEAAQIRRKDSIRYSGRFFEETKINELNRFESGDQASLGMKYGAITSIREVGYVLKALQEHKLTSIYVGRKVLYQQDGTEQVVATDSVLGTIRQSEEKYGCQHPGSVVVNDRYLYFLDASYGKYLRDAPNGTRPVSDYGMATKFRDYCDGVIGDNDSEVFAWWDEKYGELLLTIKYGSTEKTIALFEEKNAWKSFYSFIPEWHGNIGNLLISFKNGDLWKHDVGTTYNNFYGTQYDSSIEIVGNLDSLKVKEFKGLGIYSNKAWGAASDGDIVIQSHTQYPNGMTSYLPSGRFSMQEGVFYSDLLRDTSDPRFNDTLKALINGRYLRGESIRIKLTNSDTDSVTLFGVLLYITPSERSK